MDANKCDGSKISPLYSAVEAQDLQIIRMLLAHPGIELNKQADEQEHSGDEADAHDSGNHYYRSDSDDEDSDTDSDTDSDSDLEDSDLDLEEEEEEEEVEEEEEEENDEGVADHVDFDAFVAGVGGEGYQERYPAYGQRGSIRGSTNYRGPSFSLLLPLLFFFLLCFFGGLLSLTR